MECNNCNQSSSECTCWCQGCGLLNSDCSCMENNKVGPTREIECKACLGKKTYSFYGRVITGGKERGSGTISALGIHEADCPRCKGSGVEPIVDSDQQPI